MTQLRFRTNPRRGAVICGSLLSAAVGIGLARSSAADTMDFYVGAGVGQSTVKANQSPVGALGFDEHDAGWKVMAGVRPVSVLGAEFDYIEFGSPKGSIGTVNASAEARAAALFGVGYLPLPVPDLDVYAKLGLARLQTESNGYSRFTPIGCNSAASCNTSLFATNRNDTRLAYGVGAQFKLPFLPLSLRAEYERISASNGDPSLVSVGALWSF